MIDAGSWALGNRKLVYFLITVLLVGGIWAYNDMSKLEDPEIKVKQAVVVTTYPGASAHQVELEVTDVIEKNIRSMENIDNVQSRSMNDLSMITVELKATVSDNDVEQYWDLLRRKVADIQNQLPEGASASIVKDDFGSVYGMFYAVTTDGFGDQELGDYVQLLKREIQAIDGISSVAIFGERKECINIELRQDRLATLGVHPAEVLSTLNGQNKTVYSGYFDSGDNRLRVSVSDRYRNVDDIGDLLLQGHENDQLRLRDIARIYVGYEEPVRNQMRYDGKPALGLAIAAQSNTDITKIGVEVESTLEHLKEKRIPAGIEFHKVFFQPERVKDSLSTFLVNLIESVAIVIIVLMFAMGFKSGIIIGTSLVIIVFGTFLTLDLLDGTLQRVSLASFIVAMGMLVDNAIVIIDGILVDLKKGKPRQEALTSIGRKTAMPLLGATLIAILAFFPIFLSPDTTGVYVRDLFIVLAVSLLLSWLLALTHVPVHAAKFLNVEPAKENESKDPYDSKYYKLLRKILFWGLCHRIITIVIAATLTIISLACYGLLPQGFFPDMNYNQLYMEYKLPEGTNSTQVSKDLAEIEQLLLKRSDVSHVTTAIGSTPCRYNLVRSIADPSLSYGELIVDFTSPEELVSVIDSLQTQIGNLYPHAYVRLKRYNLMYEKYPIVAQFSGPDPAVLRDLTQQAMDIMNASDKVALVCNNVDPQTPLLLVDYNQPISRAIGLSRSDVGLSLLTTTGGIPTGNFYEGYHSKNIYVKCVDADGKPVENIENTPVFSMMPALSNIDPQTIKGLLTGSTSTEDVISEALRTVPLSQACNGIKLKWEDPVVVRYNGERSMNAQANPAPGLGAESARQSVKEQIEAIELPEGYSMHWEGEYSASTKSTKYLFKNFPLAIVLMIAILIMLFKDYKKPAIIFLCIPLIFTGVIFGMLISGKSFGFVAIVGVLGLIGMMIKNGIVLMDEISSQLDQGVEPVKALLDSSSSRFRPVMMASLTTILGMIPLLSDDMFGSLAVTIMGGLFVGTLITLIFVPILYAYFFKIKVK